jgi:plasmid stabilization system protein ParE
LRIKLSEAALRDIQNIRRYTLRQWGSLQEEKYLNSVCQMGLVQIARVLQRAMDFKRHIPEDLRQP